MLFTIILEFKGITSVSQFSTQNVSEAYRSWYQGLKDPWRYGLGIIQAERLASALSFDGLELPIALDSIENVWCISTHVDGDYALINFVATVSDQSRHYKRETSSVLIQPNNRTAKMDPLVNREEPDEGQ